SWSPGIVPDSLEGAHDAGCDQVSVVWRDIGQHVQADGKFNITRIEIHQMIGACRRNVVQQFLGQIAVWIDEANTVSKGDVLDDEIAQKGCLAGARFSDD